MKPGRLDHAPLCPNCGKTLDGYHCVTKDDATPSPGDITVCFDCLEPLEFDPRLNLQTIPGSRREKLLASPDIARLRDTIRAFRRTMPKP